MSCLFYSGIEKRSTAPVHALLLNLVLFFFPALRYRQDSYRHIIETVPSINQPSRANQQYPPPNLWQPNDSTPHQQQIFMSGIQRPFPGLAPVAQQPSSSGSIAQLASTNPLMLGALSSSASYLQNYPTANQAMGSNVAANATYLDDPSNLNRHFPSLDPNLAAIDLGVASQFQTASNYYPSQRNHASPSATAPFPHLFGYAQPGFNHHHHLSSNVDDASLLIQNPSLT